MSDPRTKDEYANDKARIKELEMQLDNAKATIAAFTKEREASHTTPPRKDPFDVLKGRKIEFGGSI